MTHGYSLKKWVSSEHEDIREDSDRKHRIMVNTYDHMQEQACNAGWPNSPPIRESQGWTIFVGNTYDHMQEQTCNAGWPNSPLIRESQGWTIFPTCQQGINQTEVILSGQGSLPEDSMKVEYWFGDSSMMQPGHQQIQRKMDTTVLASRPQPSIEDHLRCFRYSKNAVVVAICSRILELHQLAIEEEDQDMLRLASFLALVKFIHLYDPPVVPSLVLTYSGHLRAEWRVNSANRLALEFLDDEEIRFVLFARNKRDRVKITRITGSTTVVDIFDEIAEEHARDFGALPNR